MSDTSVDLLTIFKVYQEIKLLSKKRRLKYLEERYLVEKKMRSNNAILAFILRKRRRALFKRSCWIVPELRINEHGKFWEITVPNYTSKFFFLFCSLIYI